MYTLNVFVYACVRHTHTQIHSRLCVRGKRRNGRVHALYANDAAQLFIFSFRNSTPFGEEACFTSAPYVRACVRTLKIYGTPLIITQKDGPSYKIPTYTFWVEYSRYEITSSRQCARVFARDTW